MTLKHTETKQSKSMIALVCWEMYVLLCCSLHPVVTVAGIRSMAGAGFFSLSWLSVVIKTQSRLLERGTVALSLVPCILLG